jgi:hypothetical protein
MEMTTTCTIVDFELAATAPAARVCAALVATGSFEYEIIRAQK